jgi:hypothetical protein
MDTSIERQEVLWVPETRRVELPVPDLSGKQMRIWTLYEYQDPGIKPILPYSPVHHHNAFLEDYVHDWHHEKGVLRYFSRVIHSNVWILLEYFKPETRRRRKT